MYRSRLPDSLNDFDQIMIYQLFPLRCLYFFARALGPRGRKKQSKRRVTTFFLKKKKVYIISKYLEDFPGGAEREDGQSHHEVGDGQGHDEEVGDRAQLGGYVDRGDDEAVADNHHQVYERNDGEDRDGAGVVPDDGFHQGLAGRGVQLASRHVTSYTPPLSPTTGVRLSSGR